MASCAEDAPDPGPEPEPALWVEGVRDGAGEAGRREEEVGRRGAGVKELRRAIWAWMPEGGERPPTVAQKRPSSAVCACGGSTSACQHE